MEDLFELVKDKFITLYKKDFLSEFHKNLLTEIERFNLETINSDGDTFVRNPHVDVDELDDGEA